MGWSMKKHVLFIVLFSAVVFNVYPANVKQQKEQEPNFKILNEDPDSPFYLTGDNDREIKNLMVQGLREDPTNFTNKTMHIKYNLGPRQITYMLIESKPKLEDVVKGRNIRMVRLTPVRLSTKSNNRHFESLDESNYEFLANEFKSKFVAIGYLGEYVTLPPNKITTSRLPYLRDLYNRGLMFQMIGASKEGYPIPKRNPINFHPGTTFRNTFLEEIVLDSKSEKLPDNLKKYHGFPISKFYHVDKKFQKSELAGYLIDVYTGVSSLNGTNNLMILKQFYPSKSNDVYNVTTFLASKSTTVSEIISKIDTSQFLFLPEKEEEGLYVTYNFKVMDVGMTETLDANVHSLARPYYLMGFNCERFLNVIVIPMK
jgi:hypothetical protein